LVIVELDVDTPTMNDRFVVRYYSMPLVPTAAISLAVSGDVSGDVYDHTGRFMARGFTFSSVVLPASTYMKSLVS
jgi:hypothetical protein